MGQVSRQRKESRAWIKQTHKQERREGGREVGREDKDGTIHRGNCGDAWYVFPSVPPSFPPFLVLYGRLVLLPIPIRHPLLFVVGKPVPVV